MIQPKGNGTTHASTRRIEEPALAPMPTPADDLAQLLGAVLAYRPQPRAWPRPRPPYLPHPRRRLPRIRGVLRCSNAWGLACHSRASFNQ